MIFFFFSSSSSHHTFIVHGGCYLYTMAFGVGLLSAVACQQLRLSAVVQVGYEQQCACNGGVSGICCSRTIVLDRVEVQFGLSICNYSNCTPIGFKLVILCNCIPVRISTATLALCAFFILVLDSDLCDLTLN